MDYNDKKKLRIAFVTCVQLGLSCIEEIYRSGGQLDLLISLRDDLDVSKSGRIFLDRFASDNNIPLLKIRNINEKDVIDRIKSEHIDWLMIIGWSQIAKQELLDAPIKGCIGMHPTLLPKGRGRATIPWAILKGLKNTGVTLFKLDNGVDTGEIIGQVTIKIDENETATSLYVKVNKAHEKLISKYWDDIVNDRVVLTTQDEKEATYWPQRKPSDGEISKEMTMQEAETLVRAVTHPYPGAFFNENGRTIRIWNAKCSKNDGDIILKDGFLIPLDYDIEE